MTTIDVTFADLDRQAAVARRPVVWPWLLVHIAVLCQVAGAGVFVAGVSLMIGAIAGVVFGVATAMILGGILAFAWGALREGGRL